MDKGKSRHIPGGVARRAVRLAVVVVLTVGLAAPLPSWAQVPPGTPAVWFLGISPTLPPGDILQFRLALAHGIDRAAIVRAAAPHAGPGGNQPAGTIQHPSLPGSNPAVRGQTFDAAKAKELFAQSGWTSPLSILTTRSTSEWVLAIENALAESLRASTGATVSFAKVASFSVLTSSARSGAVPIWLYGWVSNPRAANYSMPLELARAYFMPDPEIRALVERGAGQEVEQVLADKGLIIPIVFYFAR